MGITVIEDTVQDQRLTDDAKNGMEADRTFKILNLSDRSNPLNQARLAIDSTDSTKRVARIGDPHKTLAGLFCSNVEVFHFNASWMQARAICKYTGIPNPQQQNLVGIRVGSAVATVQSNFDAAGQVMWTYYSPGLGHAGDALMVQADLEDRFKQQLANPAKFAGDDMVRREASFVNVQANISIIEFIYQSLGNGHTRFGKFLGSINLRAFAGDKPGIWRMRDLTSTTTLTSSSVNAGKQMVWESTLSFQRSLGGKGFTAAGVFKDSNTGVIPHDIGDLPNSILGEGNLYPFSDGTAAGVNGIGLFDTSPWLDWSPMLLPDITKL